MENKQNTLSPFQSHYWQVIYDYEGQEAKTEMDIPFDQIDFDKLKSFCLYPLAGQPLQVALVLDYIPGYRLIFRREGTLNMGPDPNRPGVLIPSQKAYLFILGLVEDDGSELLKLIEKGHASPRTVDWRGGIRVILPPDGKLNAIGNYDASEEVRDIGGQQVQFIHFAIKQDV